MSTPTSTADPRERRNRAANEIRFHSSDESIVRERLTPAGHTDPRQGTCIVHIRAGAAANSQRATCVCRATPIGVQAFERNPTLAGGTGVWWR